MQKKHLGNWGIVALALGMVGLYLLFPPLNDGKPTFLRKHVSEMLSSTAVVLMACGFVLALRPRVLEPYFGGLDKMYVSHKNAAVAAIVLIFTHFASMPLSGAEGQGGNIGIFAIAGLIISVLLALAPRIPFLGGHIRLAYHQWRTLHKFIGVFFLAGLLHLFLVPTLIRTTPVPLTYVWTIALIGAAAYLYKELLQPSFGRKHAHVVEAARKLNGTTLEVTLKPNGPRPEYRAGQFLFVSFGGDLAEPHPFTISSSPKEPHLRLSIKASGDWTRRMVETLKAGREATVHGCHGMLDYRAGGPEQIWIAGGIGITPFLSWVRDLEGEPAHEIDFFYTVRSEADALFWDEFQAAAQGRQRFRVHLTVSSRDGSLTMDKIVAAAKGNLADKHVYMCGPLPMTEAFRGQFLKKGVPTANIHFEEFNFR